MLTEREKQVILAINEHTEENGECPRQKDICEIVGIGSGNAGQILDRLTKKGHVAAKGTYYKQYSVIGEHNLTLAQAEEFEPPKLRQIFTSDPWGIWED